MRRLFGFLVLAAFLAGGVTGAVWHRARSRGEPRGAGPSAADLARIDSFRHRASKGRADVVFFGDSLTDYWRDYPDLWQHYFAQWSAANFGVGGDGLSNVAWIAGQVGLDRLSPHVVVILAGTNDIWRETPESAANHARSAIARVRASCNARIIQLAIFPRRKTGSSIPDRIAEFNRALRNMAAHEGVEFADFGALLAPTGTPTEQIMPDGLHLSAEGYRIWGDAITPILHNTLR